VDALHLLLHKVLPTLFTLRAMARISHHCTWRGFGFESLAAIGQSSCRYKWASRSYAIATGEVATMNSKWLEILLVLLGLFGSVGFVLWSITTIRYHITPRSLKVTYLGLPVRWIRLANIKSVTTKRIFWAERWYNTLSVGNRFLVIRRGRGLFKHLIISPKNPMVFRADLIRARDEILKVSASTGPNHLDHPENVPGQKPHNPGNHSENVIPKSATGPVAGRA
jgi:hypothetical protein